MTSLDKVLQGWAGICQKFTLINQSSTGKIILSSHMGSPSLDFQGPKLMCIGLLSAWWSISRAVWILPLCEWTVEGTQTLRKACWSSGPFKYGLFATIWSVIWPSSPYSSLGTAQLWQISNVASLRKSLYYVLDCRLGNLHLSGGVLNTSTSIFSQYDKF